MRTSGTPGRNTIARMAPSAAAEVNQKKKERIGLSFFWGDVEGE
jgi:hypothetical protein